MPEPVSQIVPQEWNAEMREAAFKFADEMTDDKDKRAYIVGILHIGWTKLLVASLNSYRPPE